MLGRPNCKFTKIMHINTPVIPKSKDQSYLMLRSGIVLAVLAGLSSIALQAQQPTEEKEKEKSDEIIKLNPYIVTSEKDVGYASRQTAVGNRLARSVIDINSSISIINAEMLRDLGATDARLALQYGTAGATPTNQINDDTNIRGFRVQYQLRDSILFLTNKKNPTFDVDRIEVIKGPAGMLIGATNYLGGVVNFVSKKPTRTRQGSSTFTAGTGEALVRGEINQSGPLTKSDDFTALYRVNLGYENLYGSKKPANSSDRQFYGLGTTFLFLKERVRLDFNSFYYKDNGVEYLHDFLDLTGRPDLTALPVGTTAGLALPTAKLHPLSTPSFVASPKEQNYENTYQTYLNAVLTAKLTDNGNLRMLYTFMDYDDDRRIVRGIAFSGDNFTMSRQDLYQHYDFPAHFFQTEYVYKTVRDFWKNELQVGAEAYWIKARTGTLILTPPPIDVRNPNYAYVAPRVALTTDNFTNGDAAAVTLGGSYFFQNNLTLLNDKLILVAGQRWSKSNVETQNLRTRSTVTTINPKIKTHRYGVILKPFGQSFSVYYTDAQNITPNIGLTTTNIPEPFKDSAGKMKEFGAKLEKINSSFDVYANFAYFNMSLTNIRGSAIENGNIVIIQFPQDDVKGWEFETGLRLKSENGHADIMFTYSDAKSFRFADKGWAVEIPENVISLWGKYTWTGTGLKGLTLGGGLYDQSKKRTGNIYYTDYPMTYNILARYDISKRWSVQVTGDNITDEYYITTVATPGLVQTAFGAQYRFSGTFRW